MYSYIRNLGRLELVAFLTGFALLAYELAAARLLAPSIGSSAYVWTSVIGVIIAALSLGYAAGGVLADRREKMIDVAWLCIASALFVLLSLLFLQGTLHLAVSAFDDPRWQALFAALSLFMPASFLLGMISPYLVRLRLRSISTAGRSVASLSALNSIGGIVGTFITGFILFGYVGSNETVFFVSVVLLIASWLLVPREQLRKRVGATIAVLLLGIVVLSPPLPEGVVADIDTPSARYQVRDVNYGGATVRVITSGPGGYQSGVNLYGSNDLVFSYTKQMAQIVERLPNKNKILVLGGGTFTLPAHFAAEYPQANIDVVEIDPELETIAKQYFRYDEPASVSVIARDARAFLNTNTVRYDVILVDAFSDTSVPFTVTTNEYVKRLKQSLTAEGVVIVNYIAGSGQDCAPLLGSMHQSYTSEFSDAAVYPQSEPTLKARQNIIIAYSNDDLRKNGIRGTATGDLPAGYQALNDNYAPIERLHHNCLVST